MKLGYLGGMVCYFVIVIVIGLIANRRNRDAKTFFLAGKSLAWYLIAAGLISQAVGGGSTVGLAGAAYAKGMAEWWTLGPATLGVVVMALLLARPLARMQQITHPEILEGRYGFTARLTALVYYVTQSISSIGVQMLVLGVLISLVTGLSPLKGAAVGALVMAIWVLIGGMLGTTWGDLLHWAILLVGLAILVPTVIVRAGGLGHILAAPGLAPHFGGLSHISPLTAVGLVFLTVPSIFSRQVYFQRLLAERSARDGLIGACVAAVIMVPIYYFIPVIGVAAHYIVGSVHANNVFPLVIERLFPSWLGILVFAALASAVMNSAAGELLSCSSNLMQDCYVRLIHPRASAKRQVMVGRGSVLLLVALAYLLLLAIPNVLSLLLFGYYGVVGGITFAWLAALYWPRVTTAGATSAMIAGGGVAIGLYFWDLFSGVTVLGLNPILIALPVSLLVLIGVSLAQKPQYDNYTQFVTDNNIPGMRVIGRRSGTVKEPRALENN
ncbi:MAG: sodium:solute symporter family protein [Acidimicrobiales bacterium]